MPKQSFGQLNIDMKDSIKLQNKKNFRNVKNCLKKFKKRKKK